MDQLTMTSYPNPGIPAAEPPIKPIVMGVYGIPGSGKSTLLAQLKEKLGTFKYHFYEGTEVITSFFEGPDGLDRFRELPSMEKTQIREAAIRKIAKEAAASGKTAILTGHFMFWSENAGEGSRDVVWTQGDAETFTHIVYLDLPQETLASRRENDVQKDRGKMSQENLMKWKCFERDELRRRCYEAGIMFTALASPEVDIVARLVDDWVNVTEGVNNSRALAYADGLIKRTHEDTGPKTVLVIDGDKTLTDKDTGDVFWKVALDRQAYENAHPLKGIFGGKGGYSYNAFRQAALHYAELKSFDDLCLEVAKQVTIYPEFIKFFKDVAQAEAEGRVKIMVVTCGMARLWEAILHEVHGMKNVDVIGGGRHADDFVVTPNLKAALVSQLQDKYGAHVWAFGDSPLDLPMLAKADRAVVVVGTEETRSQSMESALLKAINEEGLRACQVLLGETTRPRLDSARLPIIQLDDQEFLSSITHEITYPLANVVHLTDTPAAKVLMTPTRDASIEGPTLRRAHEKIGWYLATQCVSQSIGLEEHDIIHVQGHTTTGHRLRDESRTTIIALMRGGEPMAFGVSEAFPKASFVHAKHPADVQAKHLQGQKTVILVDSVVNSGKSVVDFVKHIRGVQPELKIVVVAGVVQEQAVLKGDLYERLCSDGERLKIVALRLSKNKFTGKGGTDTGNRLFNTTWLD